MKKVLGIYFNNFFECILPESLKFIFQILIQDLVLPFSAGVTDLTARQHVTLTSGNLVDRIMASMSLVSIFPAAHVEMPDKNVHQVGNEINFFESNTIDTSYMYHNSQFLKSHTYLLRIGLFSVDDN